MYNLLYKVRISKTIFCARQEFIRKSSMEGQNFKDNLLTRKGFQKQSSVQGQDFKENLLCKARISKKIFFARLGFQRQPPYKVRISKTIFHASRAGQSIIFYSTRHSTPRNGLLPRRHASPCFLTFFTASLPLRVTCHIFLHIKTMFYLVTNINLLNLVSTLAEDTPFHPFWR